MVQDQKLQQARPNRSGSTISTTLSRQWETELKKKGLYQNSNIQRPPGGCHLLCLAFSHPSRYLLFLHASNVDWNRDPYMCWKHRQIDVVNCAIYTNRNTKRRGNVQGLPPVSGPASAPYSIFAPANEVRIGLGRV